MLVHALFSDYPAQSQTRWTRWKKQLPSKLQTSQLSQLNHHPLPVAALELIQHACSRALTRMVKTTTFKFTRLLRKSGMLNVPGNEHQVSRATDGFSTRGTASGATVALTPPRFFT